jgi:hypothetical protein
MPSELWKMHDVYVRRTRAEMPVRDARVLVDVLNKNIIETIGLSLREVYITTRALKHLYDKKPAEEFDFAVDHASIMVKNPERLYKGKKDKRGGFCLVKNIEGDEYLMALDISLAKQNRGIYIVTIFRLRDRNYLKSYDLLWSRRDGAHSSPRAETDLGRPGDAPQ